MIPSSFGDRSAGPHHFEITEPAFTANDFSEKMYRLLTEPSFKANVMKMKIAAVGAGGGDRAEKVVRDFYVSSLLSEGKDPAPKHLVN